MLGRMPDGEIGFLGLGIMGSRMAARVAQAGFPLTVWTHTPGKAATWAAAHERPSPSTRPPRSRAGATSS